MRFAVFVCSAVLLITSPALADPPAPVLAERDTLAAQCRDVGGVPTFVPEFLTEGDFNADGIGDYVMNVAGLECAGTGGFFCGSAGCPVSVWLSGPNGHEIAWASYAQAVDVDGTAITAYLHGQFCDPPRPGIDGCSERLDFTAR